MTRSWPNTLRSLPRASWTRPSTNTLISATGMGSTMPPSLPSWEIVRCKCSEKPLPGCTISRCTGYRAVHYLSIILTTIYFQTDRLGGQGYGIAGSCGESSSSDSVRRLYPNRIGRLRCRSTRLCAQNVMDDLSRTLTRPPRGCHPIRNTHFPDQHQFSRSGRCELPVKQRLPGFHSTLASFTAKEDGQVPSLSQHSFPTLARLLGFVIQAL